MNNSIAIIIATYLRPTLLENCVNSIFNGNLVPSKIVLAHRETDIDTIEKINFLKEKFKQSNVKIDSCPIAQKGHIPPIEKSLKLVSEEISVILDDDTTVLENWLEELILPFKDDKVGVTGGQVVTPSVSSPTLKGKPGTYTWYGKLWGNIGAVKTNHWLEVDTVMEGNSAWRTTVLKSIKIDEIFYRDVSPFYGLFLTMSFKKLGYKIIYNSKAFVWHFNGIREKNIERDLLRTLAAQRNSTYLVLKFAPLHQAIAYFLWSTLVGDRTTIGISSLLFLTIFERNNLLKKVTYSIKGRLQAIRLFF